MPSHHRPTAESWSNKHPCTRLEPACADSGRTLARLGNLSTGREVTGRLAVSMRVARLPGSIPPSAREMLNSERLPQTRHSSCGLSLTVSQSAHNTALLREMAFNWRTLAAPMSTTEPFIAHP